MLGIGAVGRPSLLDGVGSGCGVDEEKRRADGVVAEEVVLGLQHALLTRLDRFERRVRAGVKRREVDVAREALYIRAALRPLGLSPERVLNLMPILARHGTGVLTLMRDAAAAHARTIVQGTDDPL